MPATEIQSKQNETDNAKQRSPLYVSQELRNLIGELMAPRIEMLRKVGTTRFFAEAPDAGDKDPDNDWWPDYSIYSPMHYMTEMNGLIYLMQNGLRGLTDELMTIGKKLQAYVLDNFKLRLTGGEVEGINCSDEKKELFGRFLLAQSLIKDMANYVNCCSRQCSKSLAQRTEHFNRASETKDTEDRIRLKIFDERSFNQLLERMNSLKTFLQDFCNLFEVNWKSGDEQPTTNETST